MKQLKSILPTGEKLQALVALFIGITLLGAYVLYRSNGGLPARKSEVSSAVELNPYVLKVMSEYPTDGTIQYLPMTDPGYKSFGVSKDVTYRGATIARGDAKRRCHCIGLVFEVYMSAWETVRQSTGKELMIGSGSQGEFTGFRKRFYGTDGNMGTFVDALTEYGLGVEVSLWEDAKKGDLVQLWRYNGTGHTGIFDSWVRSADGTITDIRYWQVGAETNGISYRDESVVPQSRAVNPGQLFLVRATLPQKFLSAAELPGAASRMEGDKRTLSDKLQMALGGKNLQTVFLGSAAALIGAFCYGRRRR